MEKKIYNLQDACEILGLDAAVVIPSFEHFQQEEREAMQAHAELVLMVKAVNGDWVPDWTDDDQFKWYPWFVMGSPSGGGFRFVGACYWNTGSSVGSRLCFKSEADAEFAGKHWAEKYQKYFVK